MRKESFIVISFLVLINISIAFGSDGWKINWQDPIKGQYSLTAKASDNDKAETTSPPVEISIEQGGGPPPP